MEGVCVRGRKKKGQLASNYKLTNQMQEEERESERDQVGERKRNVNTWQTDSTF